MIYACCIVLVVEEAIYLLWIRPLWLTRYPNKIVISSCSQLYEKFIISVGRVQSVDSTTELEYWNGLLDLAHIYNFGWFVTGCKCPQGIYIAKWYK